MRDATQPQDGYRRLLSDGADEMRRLESLRAAVVLKRGEAWKLAVMNRHLPNLTKTSTYWGGTMEVDIREVVSSCVLIHEVYGMELSAFFHSSLKSGQTFVDVGAIKVSKSRRKEVRAFAEARGDLYLENEDYERDPMLGAAKFFEFLGISVIGSQSPFLTTGDSPLSELIQNYQDVRDTLLNTRWKSMLE